MHSTPSQTGMRPESAVIVPDIVITESETDSRSTSPAGEHWHSRSSSISSTRSEILQITNDDSVTLTLRRGRAKVVRRKTKQQDQGDNNDHHRSNSCVPFGESSEGHHRGDHSPSPCRYTSVITAFDEDMSQSRNSSEGEETSFRSVSPALNGKSLTHFYKLWNRAKSPKPLGRGQTELPKAFTRQDKFRQCGCFTREHLKQSKKGSCVHS